MQDLHLLDNMLFNMIYIYIFKKKKRGQKVVSSDGVLRN